MTGKQSKFLLDRLQESRNQKGTSWDVVGKLPVPANVIAARKTIATANKIIQAHDKKRRVLRTRRDDKLNKAYYDVRRIILFGEPKAALRAVDSFERKQF